MSMNGRVSDRYEIGHPIEGLITTEATKEDAFATAMRWANGNTGYPDALRHVQVFDSMAHVGRPEIYCFDCETQTWLEKQIRC
jgi:hypothetical protein